MELDKQNQNLLLLAKLEALLGVSSAVIILCLYQFAPEALDIFPVAQIVVYLGILTGAFYLTIYQLIKKKYLGFSIAILTLLTLISSIIMIQQTGGFDSAFYAVWLLIITVAGLFSFNFSLLLFMLTTLIFLLYFLSNNLTSGFWLSNIGVIFSTFIALVLARLLHQRTHQINKALQRAESLAGKIGQEISKSNLMMRSIGEGIVVIDTDLNVKYLNPAGQDMVGWSDENARDINWHQVIPLRDANNKLINEHNDPFLISWQHGKSFMSNDFGLINKKGRRIALALTASPIYGSSGKVDGGIAVFRDISHEKELERQRNEFISTASHEMRSPLTAIEGYLSLALNPKISNIDPKARKYVLRAHESTKRLGDLFRDLLSVTKLEDNQFKSRVEVFEIGALVKEVIADLQFIASEKHLKLDLLSREGESLKNKSIIPLYYVSADRERIREVLTNLIDNAVKFTNEGRVDVLLSSDNINVTISIKDTGIGIAPEDIPHLFQKFYRISSNATMATGGTGLGLYLCRTIVELYGGKIWAESVEGKGSSFNFTLPRKKQPSGT